MMYIKDFMKECAGLDCTITERGFVVYLHDWDTEKLEKLSSQLGTYIPMNRGKVIKRVFLGGVGDCLDVTLICECYECERVT